jgi:glycosyltransferase AcbS
VHVVECYFEFGGFDFRLLKGGVSVYLWNLSRRFAAQGHRVSVVTASHGQLAYLRSRHHVEDLPYEDVYELPLMLDRRVWSAYPGQVGIPLRTTAHRIRLGAVDVYLLDNAMLACHPRTFYPPYESKGRDLSFFKPLAFQVDAARFIGRRLVGDGTVVHLHEPYYHFLMPAPLRAAGAAVVSTVQSNMPVNKKVYRPKVERLLEFLGVDVDTTGLDDPPLDHPFMNAMREHLPRTHLHYDYPDDYVSLFSLVLRDADLVDFLSAGQRDHYVTQRDTPFEQLFGRLTVARLVRENAHKLVVGGCAIGDSWLEPTAEPTDSAAVLTSLGLDPALPTLYHNARYAVHHKGQVELLLALDRLLDQGVEVNAIVRCISASGIDDPRFHQIAARHPGRLRLEWDTIDEARLRSYAESADICVFPSKFEMDTFLIAQGEAMACGVVPLATAQEGMRHFRHHLPLDDPSATGFAVNRSFAEDDPLLVDALVRRLREALAVLREQPARWRRLQRSASATARAFTWDACADRHLQHFAALLDGTAHGADVEDLIEWAWFDQIPETAQTSRQAAIARRAAELGDLDTYRRFRPVDKATARRLFQAAFERGDISRCTRIVERHDFTDLRSLLAQRCEVTQSDRQVQIVYRQPAAELVAVFLPTEDGWQRHALTPADGAFRGRFVATAPVRVLPVLLTLTSGRVTWDEVRHG